MCKLLVEQGGSEMRSSRWRCSSVQGDADIMACSLVLLQTNVLGARTLLGAKDIATRSDRTLLGAPGRTTSNKKLLETICEFVSSN